MTTDDFLKKYPQLYHMATADALPQIEKYGLLSSQATLDLLNIGGTQRNLLLGARRPKSVILEAEAIGRFVLRDQIPMRDAALSKCLDGISMNDWYRLLNERVFLWATRKRVETLLAARAYRKTEHLIITVDSASFLESYADQLDLSAINSGATLYVPPKRGIFTFSALAEFEKSNGLKPVVEVTVKYSIPNFKKYIVASEVVKAS